MNSYEAKQERKRERLERAAQNASNEAARRLDSARTSIDGIPSGQPILVDHYSAKRHRGALKKHDTHMRKAIDAEKAAHELSRRADAIGTGGISSDDPDAVAKLDDKRTDLERQRDHMKTVNALYRKRDAAGLTALGLDLTELDAKIAKAYSWEKQPYPRWQLSNLGARIRQAAKRVESIEAARTIESSERTVSGGVVITLDPDENRVLLRFPVRLDRDDYKLVRSRGFVWSPTRNAFVRKLSTNAHWLAEQLATQLGAKYAPVTPAEAAR